MRCGSTALLPFCIIYGLTTGMTGGFPISAHDCVRFKEWVGEFLTQFPLFCFIAPPGLLYLVFSYCGSRFMERNDTRRRWPTWKFHMNAPKKLRRPTLPQALKHGKSKKWLVKVFVFFFFQMIIVFVCVLFYLMEHLFLFRTGSQTKQIIVRCHLLSNWRNNLQVTG